MPRQYISKREKKAAKNVASGNFNSRKAALIDAGYSPQTAEKKGAAILSRPLVQSELTKALAKLGCEFIDIVRPLVDGLKATKTFVHPKLGIQTSSIPDHHERRESAKVAMDLLGGVPKVGEALPAANGLNLFISVDNGAATRVESPSVVPPAKELAHHGPNKSPADVVPPAPLPRQPNQNKINIAVSVQANPGSFNIQGKPNGKANGNGHANGHH